MSGSQFTSLPTRREELLKPVSHRELHSFQWIFPYFVSVWKGFLVWVFFPFWEVCALSPISTVGIQYGAICSPAHVPLLPSGNSVFDISRAYTCCCRGVWSNFCFSCRSKWPVEGAVFTERFCVRQSLLRRFKWRVQKGIRFPFTWKIHNPNCWLSSWDFFFVRAALKYGFLHVFTWIHALIWIHMHLTPPPIITWSARSVILKCSLGKALIGW